MNLSKYLESVLNKADIKKQYLQRFEDLPDAFKYQSQFIQHADVVDEKDIQYVKYDKAIQYKCELNAFNYAKENNDMTPVRGYAHEGDYFIEHWWVYDLKHKKHIEVSPVSGFNNYRIGTVIDKQVFDNAETLKHLLPINLKTDVMEV